LDFGAADNLGACSIFASGVVDVKAVCTSMGFLSTGISAMFSGKSMKAAPAFRFAQP
jgi:hypothetical protein